MSLNEAMKLRLNINHCRAVSSANIVIDGLTIICGSNGVGKSTISRIAQDTVEALLYYKGTKRMSIWKDLRDDVLSPIDQYLRFLGVKLPSDDALAKNFNSDFDYRKDLTSWSEYYLLLIKSLNKVFNSASWRNADVESRQCIQLCNLIGTPNTGLNDLEEKILQLVEDSQKRTTQVEGEQISYADLTRGGQSLVLWEGDVTLYENEEVVWHYIDKVSKQNSSLASVENVFYIESPMMSYPRYINGGFKLEGNLCAFPIGGKHIPKADNDTILKSFAKLISGDVYLGKDELGNPEWRFKRTDGKSFPLEMCSSGFKSLSILSILHRYNYLTNTTLLIIDEPEAHLHPEWIVEYAALLIRFIKEFGVRVVVASHSPDMVNALKTFSLAAGLSSRTNIYQATETQNHKEFEYDYPNQKLSIGGIFNSFNQVYDLIEQKSEEFKSQS